VSNSQPIRLGISRCLLGDPVRYDGGHKQDKYLTDVLGRSVEWVSVCPEVEAGLGTPREPMQLVGSAKASRLVTISTRRDLTKSLKTFSARKTKELRTLYLSGFVFKARSPSCGLEGVPLHDRRGEARPEGTGIFALAFQKAFPGIPVTEEERLADPVLREQFLSRVYEYHCRNMQGKKTVTARAGAQGRRAVQTRERRP
jgi:uncharacterized protein YbbK (DUF523 family)